MKRWHLAIAEFDAQIADDETPTEAAPDDPQISLRGGLIVSLGVLRVLWRLEDGGARFELTSDGGFRAVTPNARRCCVPASISNRGSEDTRVRGGRLALVPR